MAAQTLPEVAPFRRRNVDAVGMRLLQRDPVVVKRLPRPDPAKAVDKKLKRQLSALELTCNETLVDKPRRVTEAPSGTHANEAEDLRLDAERHFRLEIFRKPLANYIETTQRLDLRRGITVKARKMLIEEHLRCCDRMNMSTGARFLSVVYLERCLSLRQCNKTQGNLFSLACISVASKYHESFQENYDQFEILKATATGCGYSMKTVMNEERRTLRILEYDLFQPTTIFFLHHYLEKINVSIEEETENVYEMAKYLSELFMLEYYSLNHLYSIVALVCLLVAAHHFQNLKLCKELRVLKNSHEGGQVDFDKCFQDVAHCFATNNNNYVSKKYAQPRFKKLSTERIDFVKIADS